jgi:hypothetical protein
MTTSKTTKTNKPTTEAQLAQIKRDIRATVKTIARPKGSYSEIAELNKRLTKQLNTYNKLNSKKVAKVQVKVSL